jgi:hypothetical protein
MRSLPGTDAALVVLVGGTQEKYRWRGSNAMALSTAGASPGMTRE